MGYLPYYLFLFGISYALRYPWLAGLALAVYLLRDRLPDPVVYLRTSGRMRQLEADIAVNPANVTARRDLARLLLERRKPKKALALLDVARERHPDDAELLYLTGLARLAAGAPESALEAIGAAVEKEPGLAYGEPYLKAGDAHVALGHLDLAEEAYAEFTERNRSMLEGLEKLANVRSARGDREGAKRARAEAKATYRHLPGYLRRKQVGWLLRVWLRSLFD
ncbi:MAG: tetratricopeptide repeat protein [Polyangiales bacterium]